MYAVEQKMNFELNEEDEVSHVIIDEANNPIQHGDFLKCFFETYLRADPFNRRILREAAKTLIAKYELKCRCVK